MTDYKTTDDKKKDVEMIQTGPLSNYVLTISYTHVAPLEKLVQEIQRGYKIIAQKSDGESTLKISGVTRVPTKKLKLCTRMSPCGNGTNTYDHWEMRIHKRVF
jgi:small subunit ribosomal protein S20e